MLGVIRGREKRGITQSTIAHMERKSIFVCFVMGKASVSITYRNTLVRSVKVATSVTMGKKKGIARIVVVTSCAKPHTVLR